MRLTATNLTPTQISRAFANRGYLGVRIGIAIYCGLGYNDNYVAVYDCVGKSENGDREKFKAYIMAKPNGLLVADF